MSVSHVFISMFDQNYEGISDINKMRILAGKGGMFKALLLEIFNMWCHEVQV